MGRIWVWRLSIVLFLVIGPFALGNDLEINWNAILYANGAKTPAQMTLNLKNWVSIWYPEDNKKRSDFFLEGIKRISQTPEGLGFSAMKIVGKDYVALVGRLGHGVVFVDGKLYATKRFPPPKTYEEFGTESREETYEEAKAASRRELVEWVPTERGPKGWSQIIPRQAICRAMQQSLSIEIKPPKKN